MFKATYQSKGMKIQTRYYHSRRDAVDALEKSMRRRGIESGVLHLPGVVAGDAGDCVARARGLMCVLRKS